MKKNRLDSEVFKRGLATSRDKANALIMAGEVIVDGKVVIVHVDPKTKKSTLLPENVIKKVKIFEPTVKILRKDK